ncbi:hypothetical protein BECAL_00263 [Bellilinea caldifistulae]|uniref:DUF1858 domain-containing protein n=1 Tax=Bellilinea caldifistulae TaxID=360411 RepID=A0A0P6XQ92_9CHLR|nr:DUF1858 domain-containing protein [Bellilinea caldifistulae]KPL78918.1 hypothetical protein AC812_00510 [Bellilinea caldifistulae]GAP09124.1 hypothetical protein BECAL_00263 [Bellilinea caldifistulae]
MEITPKSKIHDVLTHFPQLEEEIIRAAPPFENLRNPLLRRTAARLATLEQAARIGGLNPLELVNRLRRLAGQPELTRTMDLPSPADIPPASADDPDWVRGEPQFVIDGNQLLARGEVPLNHINQLLAQLEEGRSILLITDFEPLPMIESIQKQNRKVYHKLDGQNPHRHLTYFG